MAAETASTGSGANLGFEAKLFLTADKLRGSMDASEYKHVALGLVFLKYISDAFNTVYDKLKTDLYRARLDLEHVFMPPCRQIEYNTFHTFVVQVDRREALQKHLADQGIGSAIHYPVPIHLQPAMTATEITAKKGDFPMTESQAGRILTLPVHQVLSANDIERVASTVNDFF